MEQKRGLWRFLTEDSEQYWVIAAELTRLDIPHGGAFDCFTLRGLFFPVAYSTVDEWAADLHLEEIHQAQLNAPDDWLAREEREAPDYYLDDSYPAQPDGLRYWRDSKSGRFLTSLEASAEMLALVRQQAAVARAAGYGRLICE